MQGKDEIEAQGRLLLFKQGIEKIEKQINDKFKGNEVFLQLLVELKENSELIESIIDISKDNEQLRYLALAGKEMLEELEQKIKAQNRNFAALLGAEFRKIIDYYLLFLSKQNPAIPASNMSSQLMSGFTAGRDINASMHMHQPLPPANKLPEIWNVPKGTQNFISRKNHKLKEDLLTQIDRLLSMQSADKSSVITTCHGLGGAGKTQLVIQYAKLYRKLHEFASICWFVAETREQLIQNYIMLGNELHILQSENEVKKVNQEELAQQVKTWIENKAPPGWLLIYDNAPNHESIHSLLPIRGGKILITSRHTFWPWPCVNVDVFTSDEAKAYICKVIGEHQEFDAADELIKKLGSLPLALAQACAYIQRSKPKLTIDSYLGLYNQARSILLSENKLPANEKHEPAGITWNITLTMISKECPAAVELLKLCCYLHCQNISYEIIQRFFTAENPVQQRIQVSNALSVAEEYSMITVNKEKYRISMHNLVQQVYLEQINIKGKVPDIIFLTKVVKALHESYPQAKSNYKLKRNYLIHLETVLTHVNIALITLQKFPSVNPYGANKILYMFMNEIMLPLYLCLFDAYGSSGNFHLQKTIKETALRILEDITNQSTIDNAKIAYTLMTKWGIAYASLGEIAKTKIIYEHMLKILEKFYGKDHYSLSWPFKLLGNIEEDKSKAEEWLNRSLDVAKKKFGEDHPTIAEILSDISVINLRQEKHSKALEIAERAYKIIINYPGYGKECKMSKQIEQLIDDIKFTQIIGETVHISEMSSEDKEQRKDQAHAFNSCYTCSNICAALTGLVQNYPNINVFSVRMTEESFIELINSDKTVVAKLKQTRQLNIIILQINVSELSALLFDNRNEQQHIINYITPNGREISENLREHISTMFNIQVRSSKDNFQVPGSELDIMMPDIMAKYGVWIIKLVEVYLKLNNLPEEKDLEDNFDINKEWKMQKLWIAKYPGIANINSDVLDNQLKEIKKIKLFKKYDLKNFSQYSLEKGLRNAANQNNDEDITKFIQLGVNVNAQDNNPQSKKTALHWAVIKQNKLCIIALLKVGAKFDIKDANDKTAYEYAENINDSEVIQLFFNYQNKVFVATVATSNKKNWRSWLESADRYYEQGNLEEAIQCYINVIVIFPESTHAHHNLACLYHAQSNMLLAEQHFKQALKVKENSAALCDYGFYLIKQKRHEEAAKNFIAAVSLSNDIGGLMYGEIEKNLLDKYLQQEITDKFNLSIKPFFIAHYWLIQCFLLLKDNELKQFYLEKLNKLTQQFPSALHYRILSYAYLLVGNKEKSEECMTLALSVKEIKVIQEKSQNLNLNKLYLNELSELVARSPTTLRYRVLSYIYSSIGNEEKAQECNAIALSLEPTNKPALSTQIYQNTAGGPKGYNSSLFAKSTAGALAAKSLLENRSTILQSLLQNAKISITKQQSNEIVQITFIDHKLVQQFSDELHKIGISNLSMKDEPRKPQVISGKNSKEDEYIILLSVDEYNRMMDEKEAYFKLVNSQSQRSNVRP